LTRLISRTLAAALVFAAVAGPSLAADAPASPAPSEAIPNPITKNAIDGGDTAWMLISTALVMFMVPGLALFYGGIARRKNLLGTMMQSMAALGIVGVLWVLVGYALAFGNTQSGFIGWNTDMLGLSGVVSNHTFSSTKIPIYVHCMYQGMFAIITPALISGALAERIKFGPYCAFVALWSLLIYCPLAHWVWALDSKGNAAGWLGALGAIDFAGGTVVHVAAGVSGLAAILLLRKRIGYPQHAMHPNSMVLTLFGAGILWFGWFGFNGGSGLGSGALAGSALTATQVAAATAGLVWMLIEWAHRGKPTALGFATGLVAGLVAITPASGFVKPLGAVCIGVAVSIICYYALLLKPKLKYDDSLDAFGVHGIGGCVGAILTGVLASAALFRASIGDDKYVLGALGETGTQQFDLILAQFKATAAAAAFAFVGTLVLVKVIDLIWGFCLNPKDESDGLDYAVHGEVSFDFGLISEQAVSNSLPEPKSATVPPAVGNRFTVVVDGSSNDELMKVWSDLCKVDTGPPSVEFQAVYPYVTTVQGNRFRFNSGDPDTVARSLGNLFDRHLPGKKIRAYIEKA
jgi:ammonium transporter